MAKKLFRIKYMIAIVFAAILCDWLYLVYMGADAYYPLFRYYFSPQNIVEMFTNILFVLVICIPLLVDIHYELSGFGYLVCTREKRYTVAVKKSVYIFTHCFLSVLLSYSATAVMTKQLHSFRIILSMIFVTTTILATVMMLTQIVSWLFNSTYFGTLTLIFLLLTLQTAQATGYLNIFNYAQEKNKIITSVALIMALLITGILWIAVCCYKEIIGIKKGESR